MESVGHKFRSDVTLELVQQKTCLSCGKNLTSMVEWPNEFE